MSCTAHSEPDKDCPFCLGPMTRFDILAGYATLKPEYGERLTRHWYGYCRTWFTQQAVGKIRIWDPFHRWEKS